MDAQSPAEGDNGFPCFEIDVAAEIPAHTFRDGILVVLQPGQFVRKKDPGGRADSDDYED